MRYWNTLSSWLRWQNVKQYHYKHMFVHMYILKWGRVQIPSRLGIKDDIVGERLHVQKNNSSYFLTYDSNVKTSHLYALYANLRRTRVRNFRTEPQSTVPDLTSRGIVDVFVTDITVNGNIYVSANDTYVCHCLQVQVWLSATLAMTLRVEGPRLNVIMMLTLIFWKSPLTKAENGKTGGNIQWSMTVDNRVLCDDQSSLAYIYGEIFKL